VTDGTGTATNNYIYRAFGIIQLSSETTTNRYKFVGQQGYYSDPDIVENYVRARYYIPNVGRFLSHDPDGFQNGSNLYQSFLNNPVRYRDPSGRQKVDLDFVTIDEMLQANNVTVTTALERLGESPKNKKLLQEKFFANCRTLTQKEKQDFPGFDTFCGWIYGVKFTTNPACPDYLVQQIDRVVEKYPSVPQNKKNIEAFNVNNAGTSKVIDFHARTFLLSAKEAEGIAKLDFTVCCGKYDGQKIPATADFVPPFEGDLTKIACVKECAVPVVTRWSHDFKGNVNLNFNFKVKVGNKIIFEKNRPA
jgi:RHS repeat-associated protein